MIPITKNIIVVDEQGNEYEATYPKRAKGLVKNGRARFIEENKICLACPPNNNLEDKKMSNNINIAQQGAEEVIADEINKNSKANEKFSMNYVLEQIEKIASQTEYLNQTMQKLGEMPDGSNADGMSPGNTLGKAKAEALGDLVRCRETTNQQLLRLYEKMYDDLKPQSQTDILKDILSFVNELPPNQAQDCLMKIYEGSRPKSNLFSRFDELTNWIKTLNKDEFSPESWLTIQESAKAQLSRNW